MVNPELEAIAAFLEASPSEGQRDFLAATKKIALFRQFYVEWQWIVTYVGEYGNAPKKRTFLEYFPTMKLPEKPETLSFCMERLFEREKFNRIRQMVHDVQEDLSSTDVSAASKAAAKISDVVLDLDHMWSRKKDINVGEEVERRYQSYLEIERQTTASGVGTPWPTLNRMIPPLRPKNLVGFQARGGLGKTWLAVVLATHFWRLGRKVLFITKEMGAEEVVARVDSYLFGIKWTPFSRGELSQKEKARFALLLKKAEGQFSGELIISDEEDLDAFGLDSFISKLSEYSPDVAILDGLHLLFGTTERSSGRDESYVQSAYAISRKMKRIARAKNVLLLETTQTGRDAEKGKKGYTGGGVTATQWTDALHQDCDYLFEICGYRETKYKWRELKLIKGRNCPVGESVFYKFEMDPPVFKELPTDFDPNAETENEATKIAVRSVFGEKEASREFST